MAKHTNASPKDLIRGRISILFFETLLIWLILQAERFARYRYDYLFRLALPWLLPALAGAVMLAFVILLVVRYKKKDAPQNRIFSLSFILCMLAPLFPVFFCPWLVLTGVGLNIFSLVTRLVFYGCIGYFLAFIAYYLASPASASLAVESTLCVIALLYFYEMYLSGSTPIMTTPESGYLTVRQNLLLLAVLLAVLFLLLCALRLIRPLKKLAPRPVPAVCPPALTLILLTVLTFIPLSWVLRRGLIYGMVALLAALFLLICALLRKRVVK